MDSGDWIGSVGWLTFARPASVMSCATFPMDNSSKTLTQVADDHWWDNDDNDTQCDNNCKINENCQLWSNETTKLDEKDFWIFNSCSQFQKWLNLKEDKGNLFCWCGLVWPGGSTLPLLILGCVLFALFKSTFQNAFLKVLFRMSFLTHQTLTRPGSE